MPLVSGLSVFTEKDSASGHVFPCVKEELVDVTFHGVFSPSRVHFLVVRGLAGRVDVLGVVPDAHTTPTHSGDLKIVRRVKSCPAESISKKVSIGDRVRETGIDSKVILKYCLTNVGSSVNRLGAECPRLFQKPGGENRVYG